MDCVIPRSSYGPKEPLRAFTKRVQTRAPRGDQAGPSSGFGNEYFGNKYSESQHSKLNYMGNEYCNLE